MQENKCLLRKGQVCSQQTWQSVSYIPTALFNCM